MISPGIVLTKIHRCCVAVKMRKKFLGLNSGVQNQTCGHGARFWTPEHTATCGLCHAKIFRDNVLATNLVRCGREAHHYSDDIYEKYCMTHLDY